MKGDIISKEFQKMVWVHDKDGKEYACRIEDPKNIKRKEDLTDEEQEKLFGFEYRNWRQLVNFKSFCNI